MPITVDRNASYGGTLVTEKYAPLAKQVPESANRAIYAGLLTYRAGMLNNAGLLARGLALVVPDWPTITTTESTAGRLPPLVVVSSNRAEWIRKGIDAGRDRLAELGIAQFDNVSDLRALSGTEDVSPPLYAPSRAGPNRSVYVVVHTSEYANYQEQLNGTGITPVGWRFKPAGVQATYNLVGFGASRFAAMEFCKYLRRRAMAVAPGGVARWNAAWMIDDNTVALTGAPAFPGFAAVEAALGNNVCAGFSGGSSAEPRLAARVWANKELNAGRGVQPPNPQVPGSTPPGIVQQTALWNVRYFDQQFLNFGPAFIASAEDLSLTNYFNSLKANDVYPYQFYNGIGVMKEVPEHDNGKGANSVNRAREDLAAWVTAAESATQAAGTPPPPIAVEPVKLEDRDAQTLSAFVVTKVLPNAAAVKDKRDDPATQARAKSQAVEQIATAAINAKMVSDAAINATFKINGGQVMAITPVSKP